MRWLLVCSLVRCLEAGGGTVAEPIYIRTRLGTYVCCRNCGHASGNHAASRCFQRIGPNYDVNICDCKKWEA